MINDPIVVAECNLSHVVGVAEFNSSEHLVEIFPDDVLIESVRRALQLVQQGVVHILKNQAPLLLVRKHIL